MAVCECCSNVQCDRGFWEFRLEKNWHLLRNASAGRVLRVIGREFRCFFFCVARLVAAILNVCHICLMKVCCFGLFLGKFVFFYLSLAGLNG